MKDQSNHGPNIADLEERVSRCMGPPCMGSALFLFQISRISWVKFRKSADLDGQLCSCSCWHGRVLTRWTLLQIKALSEVLSVVELVKTKSNANKMASFSSMEPHPKPTTSAFAGVPPVAEEHEF